MESAKFHPLTSILLSIFDDGSIGTRMFNYIKLHKDDASTFELDDYLDGLVGPNCEYALSSVLHKIMYVIMRSGQEHDSQHFEKYMEITMTLEVALACAMENALLQLPDPIDPDCAFISDVFKTKKYTIDKLYDLI